MNSIKDNRQDAKAWRNDAYAKVTGSAKYTDDMKMNGMLHGVPVYTNEIHGKIISINTSEASTKSGVVAVITADDIPGEIKYGQIIRDYPILVKDKICSTGDVVAVIIAKTREQAKAAVPFVKVRTKKLPPVFDPEKALDPKSVLVHEEFGNNIVNHHCIRRGDLSKGEKDSDLIIEQDFETSRIEHSYLEPETALCWLRSDGVMEVYGSMQHPFSTRRFVASTLGVSLSEVEVRSVPMGGGFGGKDDLAAINCARAALVAKITGRPVKITYDREWSFRESYKRHPYKMQYRMGLKKNGKISFVECRLIADGGAYCSVTPWVTWRSTVQCCGPYFVPHVKCDTYGVYTNNIFCGAMRGFGSPQVCFSSEQLIEIAAERLGISEIEMRRINMLRQGSETITGQRLDTHKVSLEEVLDRVIAEIDYHKKRKKCSFGNKNQKEWYGIGLAMSYRGMSLGAEGIDFNSAIINIQNDGSVLLETAVHENGQGAETTMMRILAEELGIDIKRIRYRQPSTSNIPDGGTTVASRGTLMGGGAVVLAAKNLKAKMAKVLASDLSSSPQDIIFKNETLISKDKKKKISFDEAIKIMFNRQEYPYSFGQFQGPSVSWNEKTGQGNAYFTWVYGCQAVELKVIPASNKIILLNMVAAHDIGKAVDIHLLKGQFYGGMTMGAGYGLFEEWKTLKDNQYPANFNQYRVPRSIDMPEMTAIIIENRDPLSPSGAKGIGEPTNELMAPAIANALYAATGKRFTKQPLKLRS
ncbi:MAG: xanthine dehydrogenase family protein molybdopterin-binding subunit [Candidatus Cloacimonetes bacterium]|nr:xanthine dehydrogenase family protein molybdopterin-binding subunit [Candidatus Cloacimonadota bacterium]